ncbi:sugar transferase [Anaerococcus nagyae]|uniref:sugar transferase n=1 Tax=Anaerococcus nagyae TaxID=1755241 RepID=UPI001AEAD899|nr:sugar transferase [Anaerococcus nagyae]MBP2068997.1 lipopolysaccharide/colanic/teichoic acid biosynthesis glycosyltransferase [Anaerococcus nagyae]
MKPYIVTKRILDVLISLILIILLSPLLLIISIAITIDSPGPVFYRQTRTGLNGKDFTLIKFRSMAADNDVYDFKTGDKITKVGHFIRKTSLDELPQLINILEGDMSFIGPRPWLPLFNEYYTEYQKQRFLVRPGITGLAQVSGRKDLRILDRIDYDVKYVKSMSFRIDTIIFLKTIEVILKKENNTYANYTIEDEFNDLIGNYERYT